jgi:2-polyprenyl-6-methoxyphenol hydroxylase-like FAD-dependent oxidoreductase
MARPQRILIVGAGIAGLSLALALRRRGLSAELIERSPAPTTDGAGLYLVGAATRALHALGLRDAALDRGCIVRTQSLFDRTGSLIARTDVDAFWSGCGPCAGVTRAALHGLLTNETKGMPIRYGVALQSLRREAGQVVASCSDASQAPYDLVVGADGIRSTVRRLEFGDGKASFRGQVGWRFIAPMPVGVSGWSVFMGEGRVFLFVPMGNDAAYCYADRVVTEPPDDPERGRVERLRALFRDFALPVRETLAAIREDHPIHYAPIEEVIQTVPGRDNVVLIGDAAHAMSPNMACGAAMSLEDALTLAELIGAAGDSDLGDGLVPTFVRRRAQRVDWVRQQTHRRDKMRGLPRLVRNAILGLLWNRLYRVNYRPLLSAP